MSDGKRYEEIVSITDKNESINDNNDNDINNESNDIDINESNNIATCLLSILVCSYGQSINSTVAYYIFYEFASRVTSISFSVFMPLLITSLGDDKYNDQGKSIWSYVSAIVQVINALSFLTFTSVFEYGLNRRSGLIFFASISAISLMVFIFCVNPSMIYLACIAAIFCRVSNSISSLAYDSLLDCAGSAADPIEGGASNNISSKGGIVGYFALISFAIFAGIIIIIIYYGLNKNVPVIWLQGIIPLFLAGLWYGLFLIVVERGLPKDFGSGLKLESQSASTSTKRSICSIIYECLSVIRYAFVTGSQQQYENLIHLMEFPDCALYILAFIFLTGAASVVTSVATIVATSVLSAGIVDLGLCALLGVLGAIAGLSFFKQIVECGLVTAKWVLVTNTIIIIGLIIFTLYIKSIAELYVLAVWGGTQVGSFGAFSRSLYSSLAPKNKQARFFSLLQFSQDSTSWIPSIIIAAVSAKWPSDRVYIRTIVISCLVEIAIGLPCLLMINVERGINARKNEESKEILKEISLEDLNPK